MRLLLVVANYPHAGHPYSGAFNERSALALQALGHDVEVLAPRPYVPRALAGLHARWRAYDRIAPHESRSGLSVHRPAYPQLPVLGSILRPDWGAYLSSVAALRKRHEKKPFEAILAFNLIGAGALAWRLGRLWQIPAACWATGNDVRVARRSAHGRAVRRALERLDLLFYQSSELFERAAALCGVSAENFSGCRHAVLPRGVEPAPSPSPETRRALRSELRVRPAELLVLFVGRIVRAKGVFELADAIEIVRRRHPEVVCALVGAHAGFDDSAELCSRLERSADLAAHARVLPACVPDRVWDYLHAADIFAFPSYNEGMPNSLLEAMAAGVPAVASAIPPMRDIDAGCGALRLTPPGDAPALAGALTELARSAALRADLARRGRARILDGFSARASMAEAVLRLSTAATHGAARVSGQRDEIAAAALR